MAAPQLSEDIRWLIVFKHVYQGLRHNEIIKHLSAGPVQITRRQISRALALYASSGEVMPKRRVVTHPESIFTRERCRVLIGLLLDSPEDYLKEIRAKFTAATGTRPTLGTLCKAIKKAGFTRKKLCTFAAHRSRQARHDFWYKVFTRYDADQLFFLDETSKDPRAAKRTFGYAMTGKTPIASRGYMMPGHRVSSLCGYDINGFVCWEHTTGTFDRDRFLAAVRRSVLPHVGTAGGRRSVVIVDNASIHKCSEFVDMINSVGGILLYMPPYCFDLTPLDNGAFGQVRRWLQSHSEKVAQRGVQWALDEAFRSVGSRSARAHYRECGWIL